MAKYNGLRSRYAERASTKGKGKGKGNVDLYSAFIVTAREKRSDMDHSFTCKQHHTCFYLVSVHYMAVWLSGNAFASINVVALRQTRLVSGWVTVCGRVNHLGM